MKHIILLFVMLLIGGVAMSQSTYQKIDDKTFQSIKSTNSNYTATGYYYIAKDGVKYEIYTHTVTKGKNAGQTFCYIKKVSKKTGKSYWQKINVKPEELSK